MHFVSISNTLRSMLLHCHAACTIWPSPENFGALTIKFKFSIFHNSFCDFGCWSYYFPRNWHSVVANGEKILEWTVIQCLQNDWSFRLNYFVKHELFLCEFDVSQQQVLEKWKLSSHFHVNIWQTKKKMNSRLFLRKSSILWELFHRVPCGCLTRMSSVLHYICVVRTFEYLYGN